MKSKNFTRLPWVASLTVACSLAASAATFTWDSGATANDGIITSGSATWNAASTWWTTNGGVTNTTWVNDGTSTAVFGQIAATTTLTLGAEFKANSLLFNSTASTWVVGGTSALNLMGTAPSIYAGTTTQINAPFVGSAGLTKTGSGSLAIQSSASNSGFTGGLTVKSGIFELNFANMANGGTDLVNSSNTLALDGASAFRMRAKSGGVSNSQTLGAVTLNGASSINITGSTGVTSTLTLGAFTRNPGATVNFATTTTGTNVFNAPVGTNFKNWATIAPVNLAGSGILNYASVDGSGKVIARAATGVSNLSGLSDTGGTVDYDLADTVTGSVGANLSANSIRYTGTAAGTLGGASNLTVNSLMNGSAAGLWTIGSTANSGTITIGAGNELVIHPGKGGITINSKITGAGDVTINGVYAGGGSGAFSLASTTSDYTGTTTINGSSGSASVPSDSAATITLTSALGDATAVGNLGKGGDVALNGAVIKTNAANQTTTRNFSIAGVGGFFTQGGTLTLNGSISGTGNLYVDSNAGGGLTLGGNNSISGDVVFVTDGKLTLNHANALKNATINYAGQRITVATSGNHAFNIGGLKGRGGDINLGSATAGGGNGMVSIGSNNQSNEFYGSLSGTAGLNKVGTGTQTLLKTTYSGNTVVSEGTLKLGSVSQMGYTTDAASSSTTIDGVSRTQLRLNGPNIQGFVAGQTIKVSGQDKTIYGVGYDGTKTYLYLTDNTLGTSVASGTSGTAEALNGSIASTTIEVKSGAYLDVRDVTGFTLGSSQTLAGMGTVQGAMRVAGTLSPGNSPGTLTTGGETWLDGGDYNWQVHNATGAAGTGYDTVAMSGTLDLTSLTTGQFNINLWSLSAISPSDVNGDAINFSNLSDYAWTILTTTGGITGFDVADFTIHTGSFNGTNGFTNALAGGTFSLSQSGDNKSLILNYAAVPEPGTALLGGLGLLAILRRRRQ